MIIVTGAAGFIGSCFVSELNRAGIEDIILSDDFSDAEKNKNLIGKKIPQQNRRPARRGSRPFRPRGTGSGDRA